MTRGGATSQGETLVRVGNGGGDRPQLPAPSIRNPESKPTSTTLTILIVDDDAATNETFARLLRLEGYQVRTALSAAAGLGDVETHPPDAILLDFRMPQVDGLGFLQQVRARDLGMPVAIVTGDYFIDETVMKELRDLGAETWFKPLWLDDLTALVRKLLGGTRH